MISSATTASLFSATDYSTATAGIPSVPTGQVGSMSNDQIDKVSNDFESMFIGQMLDQMFGDSVGTEAYGDSQTSDVYKGLMMDEYGKIISRAGGIGIADYVKRELLKLQEK